MTYNGWCVVTVWLFSRLGLLVCRWLGQQGDPVSAERLEEECQPELQCPKHLQVWPVLCVGLVDHPNR